MDAVTPGFEAVLDNPVEELLLEVKLLAHVEEI